MASQGTERIYNFRAFLKMEKKNCIPVGISGMWISLASSKEAESNIWS